MGLFIQIYKSADKIVDYFYTFYKYSIFCTLQMNHISNCEFKTGLCTKLIIPCDIDTKNKNRIFDFFEGSLSIEQRYRNTH